MNILIRLKKRAARAKITLFARCDEENHRFVLGAKGAFRGNK